MKTPIDTVRGVITDIDERTGDVTIHAKYDDWFTLTKRGYRECLVQMVDSRPLSDVQRNACYALIREISEYTGEGKDPTKELMKLKFLAEELAQTGDQIFSLSNAPMSLVCAFQRFLVHFILDWDIPCRFPLLKYVDDISDYVYYCLMTKKCCICGQPAQLHHVDRVGMGRDRTDICHEGLEALPLCGDHHQENHNTSDQEFFAKYHLDGGIKLDKTLCRHWHLKARKQKA